MEVAAVVAVVLAFIGFRQWLRHQRRVLIHRERLAAIEKGVELPPWPEEPDHRINVKRVLLLSGLVWLALGVGGMVAMRVMFSDPAMSRLQDAPPPSIWLAGLIPTLVGAAHLIVYKMDRS